MIRNQTVLIEKENNSKWKVQRRTRGQDIVNGPYEKPTLTWVLVLENGTGERRFVPEGRIFEFYDLESVGLDV